MTRSPFRHFCLPALAALAVAFPAAAQPPQTPPPPLPADGTELFRGLFAVEGVSPLGTAEDENLRTMILVLYGLPNDSGYYARLSRETLKAGGAVLLLTEQRADLGQYFPDDDRPQLTATGERPFCPDPNAALGGNGRLPFVRFQPAAEGTMPTDALLYLGMNRVAANAPAALQLARPSRYARPFAFFPAGCTVGEGSRTPLPKNRLYAVWGSGPADSPFRSLVIADTSAFINGMLALTPDRESDNLAFALRVVRWLKGEGRQARTRCLFVENGVIRPTFDDAGLSAALNPPIPVIDPLNPKFQEALTDFGNRTISKIQDEDRIDRRLAGTSAGSPRFGRALRTVAVLLAVAAAAWLFARMRAARHRPDVPPPPRDPRTDGAAAGSAARRQVELVQSGRLTEPVREFVLGLFHDCGLPPSVSGGPAPAIEVTGRSRDLRREVQALWGEVLGPAAKPVTPDRWKELGPMIEAVKRAADAGRWRVVPEGGAA